MVDKREKLMVVRSVDRMDDTMVVEMGKNLVV